MELWPSPMLLAPSFSEPDAWLAAFTGPAAVAWILLVQRGGQMEANLNEHPAMASSWHQLTAQHHAPPSIARNHSTHSTHCMSAGSSSSSLSLLSWCTAPLLSSTCNRCGRCCAAGCADATVTRSDHLGRMDGRRE